jgi:hypothetical protein
MLNMKLPGLTMKTSDGDWERLEVTREDMVECLEKGKD